MDDAIERRDFVRILAGAGVAGTAFLNGCMAQPGADGSVSPQMIQALLSLTGQSPPGEEELEAMANSLERHFENIRTVRAYPIPQTVEPSLKFRASPYVAARPAATA